MSILEKTKLLITNINKDFKTEKYEKSLNREVSIQKFTKKSWRKSKELNPHLINNIANGIILSGELEVL